MDLVSRLHSEPRAAIANLEAQALRAFVRRSAIKREIAEHGRSERGYAMVREYTAKRRVLALLRDAYATHPETIAAVRAEESAMRHEAIAMNARRKARVAENRRARETGVCPRCQGMGYLPNVIQDGARCYRCHGTGR